MTSARIICAAAILFAGCAATVPFASAQQPPSSVPSGGENQPAARKASAAEAAKGKPKLSEEQNLALQLLETSEAASRGFEAPMRTYSLMNIAQSFTVIEPARARGLLRDAFRASLEIHDDNSTKSLLQQETLRTLLPLSQDDVEELLPQAEANVRKPIAEIIVGRYAEKKQFEKALELVNQMSALDEFPYSSAGKLMDAMPAEMIAERQGLFAQAVSSYKTHDHKRGILIGPNAFTDLVVRFGAAMPPKLVLVAIDDILTQAKAKSEEQMNVTVGGDSGTASFGSGYEYQLFALLPLLRQLDEGRAKQLLEENQTLQAKVQQYPQGLSSLNPPPAPEAGKEANNQPGLSTTVHLGDSSAPGAGLSPAAAQAYMNQEALRKAREVAQEGETDPTQAIAHSMTLPVKLDGSMGGGSPRAGALEAIAKANVKKNPTGAEQALSELRKISGDLPLRLQAQYLSSAADLYLQLSEKDNAEKVVSEGFKVAEKLLEIDANPDNPNRALKAWWPAADAYRRFVEVQARISNRATSSVLKEIKDPEIQATESIMVARSLLGLPLKRFMVAEKRKDVNTMSMTTN